MCLGLACCNNVPIKNLQEPIPGTEDTLKCDDGILHLLPGTPKDRALP